jgi:phosphoheptose isomerase
MQHHRLAHQLIAQALRDGARLRQLVLERCSDSIADAATLVADALLAGNKILIFGNGGSAADAQHVAAELVGRFVAERRPLPAIALTVDSSALTAIGNDYGFDQIYARQVRALGRPGDVAIAISTSGRSPNILAAVEASREMGMKVVGLTGGKGQAFAELCDGCVVVPSTNTARIQEIHITVGHVICEVVDARVLAHVPDSATLADVEAARASHPKAAGPEAVAGAQRVSGSTKELDLPSLLVLRQRWRSEGRTVVWTNGAFDMLHAGHLSSLQAARRLGDILVVGVNADATVTKAKGETRPIFPAHERVAMLAALEVVDYVMVFEEPTPVEVITVLQPDIHCKGADYAPPNGAPIPEAAVVQGYGGRIAFLPLVPDRSTTSTVRRAAAAAGAVGVKR